MNWIARCLLISESFYEFGVGLLGPIYAIFVENIGGDLLTAGWAWATFSIVCGITLYSMGKFEDKLKKDKWIAVFGFILTSLGILGYSFVSSPWQLFLVQILLGFGWAFGTPAIDSLYAKNIDVKKMDSQWGAWEASMRIMQGFSAIIGAAIAYTFGFKVLFLVMFGFSLVSVFVVARLVWNEKRNLKRRKLK